MTKAEDLTLVPQGRLQKLLGVSGMTLWRWQQGSDFPTALVIQGRKYFKASEIEVWINKQQGEAHRPPNR